MHSSALCCKLRELCSESAVCSVPFFCKERGKGCISKWGGGGEAPLLSERRRGRGAKGHFLRGGGRPKDI